MIKSSCRWRYSKGATLLEVMIAAAILGVGLLGIAALQMTSLQGSSNAEYRGRASDLAWSLADRMRANLPGIAGYASAIATNCTAPLAICAMVPGATDTSAVTQCTPAQVAAYDLWEIRCSNGVRTALPGGTMLVTSTTNASGPIANIQINWQTRTTDNSAQTLTDRLSITVMPGTDPTL
ncbi:MAG: hypothetical protein IEMM0001_2310 [bacterium]|nr:MAG: hypothetical protein IEMM0001_2310 [bacterium]